MPDSEATTLTPSPASVSADAGPKPKNEIWQRWQESFLAGFAVWAIGLVTYYVVTAVSWLPTEDLTSKAGAPPATFGELLSSWHRWDTTWYVIIADFGYHFDGNSTAFFPLYPMLVRGANYVVAGGSFEAAIVVSLIACLAALVMMHRLSAEMLGRADARRATFYLLAFPTGFYLVAAYTESLFLALAIGSLYWMRRGHWWWAGVLGAFASATRMAGVMLAAAFAYEYLRQRGFSWRKVRFDALGIALVPAGLGVYMAYLAVSFGDPFRFLKSQEVWFHYGYTNPLTTIKDVFLLIHRTEPLYGPTTVRNIINLTAALGVLVILALVLAGPWRLGADHAYLVIFAAIVILMPLSNPIRAHYPLSSMWRFALECTVVFMWLARRGRNHTFDRAYLAIALALQGAMVVTFVQNQFVA
ncbi:hypothetical protein Rhe02_93300 [Rhizocola hellebori]|uniref:Glycosyltransferase RgtA/B/C/D-like domain-containing protein n=1 Tax=Rhizocola hellebori TaxID=1392758 RepID=A0A8J3VML7_9ACTN|nr:mannosyltransferase family protein [Rhizocola hellebori]GIH11263.1 hypothetical protein Rhe02_93300 [Rhizocola hellebori]